MGKPTEQWYAIDHVSDNSGKSAVEVTNIRANGVVGVPSNGAGAGSRLWTSARRSVLNSRTGGDAEVSNGITKTLDFGKVRDWTPSF